MPYECAQQGALDRCGRWYHSNKLMISGDDLCLSYSQALEDEIERQLEEEVRRQIRAENQARAAVPADDTLL